MEINKYKDRVGQVIRGCEIVGYSLHKINNHTYTKYDVICKCGKKFKISAITLFNGSYKNITANCGCVPKKFNSIKVKLESHLGKTIRGVFLNKLIRSLNGIKLKVPKYECKCVWGSFYLASSSQILKDSYKNSQASCGCTKRNPREQKRDYKNTTYNRYYNSVEKSARKRNLDFTLSKEQFVNIVKLPCFYCNVLSYKNAYKNIENQIFIKKENKGLAKDIISIEKWKDIDKYTVVCSGIDRSDNNKGYTLENSLPCCTRCNIIKHRFDTEDFYNHIKKILKVKQQRESNEI